MTFKMSRSRLGPLVQLKWILLLVLLLMLNKPDVVEARAKPEANPNPQERPNNEGENYTDYTEYGEEVYGMRIRL